MALRKYGWRSLRVKILLASVIVQVTMLSLLVWNSVRLTQSYLTEQTTFRIKEIFPLLNTSISGPLFQEDLATLAEIVEHLNSNRSVYYILIRDSRGEDIIWRGEEPKNVQYEYYDFVGEIDYRQENNDGMFYAIRMPINIEQRVIGSMRVVVDTRFIKDSLQTVRNQGIAIASIEIILTIILLALIGIGLTRHVKQLSRSAKLISNGDLSVRLDIETKDEIGDAAIAFNHMMQVISDNKQDLERHKDRIQLLLDSTAEGIYGMDLQGYCTFANAACLMRLGYGHESEMLGKNVHRLIHHTKSDGSSYPEEECTMANSLNSEGGIHLDTEMFWKKNGEGFSVEYWSYPVIAAGKVVGTVVTFIDITNRIQQLKERERFIEDLELKNEALKQFTYAVSHDLKSPVVTIQGFLGMLQKDIEAGAKARIDTDIKHIHDAAISMQILLDELLALAKIGRLEVKQSLVPIGELVHEAIQLTSGRIQSINAEIQVMDGLPELRCDKPRILEVFQNLIDNALKFMGDQPYPRVDIGAINRNGEYVLFVRDNGIGIASRYHEKIFGLFNRLDQRVAGTGMGLALVKRIIQLHHGKIWVESEGDGTGSCFYFVLPQ